MLYLISGGEFHREEFVGQLKARMRQLPMGEHNIDEFGPASGAADVIADVIAACNTAPFLCEKRMVIARGLLAGSRARSTGRAPRGRVAAPTEEPSAPSESLTDYVPRLPETTHLLVVEERASSLQALSAVRPDAYKRDCPPLRENVLPRWIADRARKQYAANLSQAAARELAQLVGSDLRALDSEIAKVVSYAEPGHQIEVEDVRALVSGGGLGIFEFHDAVAERRPAAALAAAHRFMAGGTDPAEVFAQLAGLVRRLLIVKELAAQRRSVSREAPAFGLTTSPYALDKLQRQAATLSAADLERAYRLLRDTDIAIKTGKMDPGLAVELAVAQLVGLIDEGVEVAV